MVGLEISPISTPQRFGTAYRQPIDGVAYNVCAVGDMIPGYCRTVGGTPLAEPDGYAEKACASAGYETSCSPDVDVHYGSVTWMVVVKEEAQCAAVAGKGTVRQPKKTTTWDVDEKGALRTKTEKAEP